MWRRYMGHKWRKKADRQVPSNGPCLKCGAPVRHHDPEVRICVACAEEAYDEQSRAARQEWRKGE